MNVELLPFLPVVKGFSMLFKPHVEVVLHDLNSQRVCALENNFSKRHIGSPSCLDHSSFEEDVIGPYEKINWDGRRLKSLSIVVRNASKKEIGLLCINVDLSHFEAIRTFIDHWVGETQLVQKPESLFKDDWQEKINQFIQDYIQNHQLNMKTLSRQQKRELVIALIENGAFQVKGVAMYLGDVIGLSRATIYKYLTEWKGEQK